jgi:hypothetical protein
MGVGEELSGGEMLEGVEVGSEAGETTLGGVVEGGEDEDGDGEAAANALSAACRFIAV